MRRVHCSACRLVVAAFDSEITEISPELEADILVCGLAHSLEAGGHKSYTIEPITLAAQIGRYTHAYPVDTPRVMGMPLIHLVFSNLKTWINGVHHGVEPQHLQAYCNEFTFRFNRRFYPFNSFRSLLGIAVDSEAHTYAGLYSGRPAHTGEIRESA
jgi:ISXO2-like transposase domain